MRSIADLLDDAPAPAPRDRGSYAPRRGRVGRPSKEEVEAGLQAAKARLTQTDLNKAATGSPTLGDWAPFLQPVTVNWLAKVFRMDPQTVKKRLVNCQPLGEAAGGRPLYDFVQAAGYLVKPMMDIGEYIRSLDPNKLPNHINKTYWEAMRIRLKFMLEARQAWRADMILDVFSEAAKIIKNQSQLWVDNLAEETSVDDDQRRRLAEMVDELNKSIHAQLVEMPRKKQTLSLAAEWSSQEVEPGDTPEFEDVDGLLD